MQLQPPTPIRTPLSPTTTFLPTSASLGALLRLPVFGPKLPPCSARQCPTLGPAVSHSRTSRPPALKVNLEWSPYQQMAVQLLPAMTSPSYRHSMAMLPTQPLQRRALRVLPIILLARPRPPTSWHQPHYPPHQIRQPVAAWKTFSAAVSHQRLRIRPPSLDRFLTLLVVSSGRKGLTVTTLVAMARQVRTAVFLPATLVRHYKPIWPKSFI
jgi:hypothetical protein